MPIIIQVVSQMQNMQRERKHNPCFQGYHSVTEKAGTSKKAQQKAIGAELRVNHVQ